MRRNLAVILAAALSLSMAGCGAASSTGSTTAAQSESETGEGSTEMTEAATEAAISLLARLQELTDNNVIDQDTLDAIIAYIEANNIQLDFDDAGMKPDGGSGEAPADKPEGGSGEAPDGKPEGGSGEALDGKPEGGSDEAPADKPDGGSGEAPADKPDEKQGEKPADGDKKPEDAPQGSGTSQGGHSHTLLPQAVLDELLDNHVITQDDYDAIAKYQKESSASQPGDAPDGKPGEAPDGKSGGAPGGMPGGMSSADINYVGATTISEETTASGESYSSETADESALIVEGSTSVTLTNPTVTKTGDSEGGDNCNFYGVNAGVLAKDGTTLNISGGTITTDAKGANGVFSYGGNGAQNGGEGDGTTVNISDTIIKTTGDGAGGIMTAGGGVTNASDLTIETSGQSSAAIRTDRGGGTVVVEGGSYTTNGLGSPAIYSTADITVSNAALTSNQSEGVCIEGKNSITLTNCDFTVNNTKCNGHATFLDSIMIYQSMSGDADSGTSAFTMTGGSLTSKNGHVFHVTNTNAVITLDDVTITNEDSDNVLLSVCDDGWNGAENIATFKASSQTLSGKILVGDNSKLTLELADGSSFTGSIGGQIENSKGSTVSTEVGEVNVTLDSSSTWTLTADSYITSFDGNTSQIVSNGYKLYVNGKALSLK
jgi:hypothetical protein